MELSNLDLKYYRIALLGVQTIRRASPGAICESARGFDKS